MINEITYINFYPSNESLVVINKKWNIELIRDMFLGKKRFKEFKEGNPNISNKVLSDCLKNLENKSIIEKRMVNSNATSSEYYLTKQGKELNRIIYEIVVFAQEGNFQSLSKVLKFLSKKWNIKIIKDIFFGKKHFKEFKEGKSDLSNKVLSDCLKNLENNGIIEKRIISTKHVSTEYHLTELGKSLNQFIYELTIFTLENSNNKEYKKESASIRIKEDFKEALKINY